MYSLHRRSIMRNSPWSDLYKKEDWWAIWFAFVVFAGAVAGIVTKVPKIGKWTVDPTDVFLTVKDGIVTGNIFISLMFLWLGLGLLTLIGIYFMKEKPGKYLLGFTVIFILSIISYALSHQKQVAAWGFGYAFWGLVVGLLISNTTGTPNWMKNGVKTEMYIKTGLVLLGAEILFNKILQLGGPGLFVAWFVTPIVIIFMFIYGVKALKIKSKSLVMVIAAATSVCGVSAAIAAAAASNAKKDELTLAVGMSLIFTVIMMILMPPFIVAVGLDAIIGAAWMGGTIDSTGAVVAAGAMLGADAEKVAAVVKMIQNILIGLVAFFIALYWVAKVERDQDNPKPSFKEIWYRMPKFIVGFLLSSLLFSFVLIPLMGADIVEKQVIGNVTEVVRNWLFCLAFVSIGLESNFKELAGQMVGGKPMILYVVGQSFNLVLTLLAAWLAFGGILWPKVM